MSARLYFIYLLYTVLIFPPILTIISNGIGTVLFSASDIHKQCWSPEEIAVLTTRMILEDLLPDIRILKIDSDEYVNDIVDYFRLLIEATRKMSCGRKKHITMLALTDLLGGYLQHAVLPISRGAYYAGIIEYSSMEKLIQLFEELKWFLRTNGQGWSLPTQDNCDFDVQPVDLHAESAKRNGSCCRSLIYYRHEPLKKCSPDAPNSQSLFFPVPFLDAKVRPSAIAVPFKRFALRNIGSKKAAYLVMKYFVSVERCFEDLHVDEGTVEKFHNNLFTWVENQVIPKLKDDKFYSAFGGILRVEETLRSLGARVNEETSTEEEEGEEEIGAVPGGESSSRSSMVLMAMLIIIFVWFIIGTLFICYRMRANNMKGKYFRGKSDGTSSGSASSRSSRWSMPTKSTKRSTATCKCCMSDKSTCRCSSQTEKSTSFSSTHTSESDEKQAPVSMCYPLSKPRSSYSVSCCPAIIDTKHSMKVLPSIPEMSENSSVKKAPSKNKKITFEDGGKKEDAPKNDNGKSAPQSKVKVCVQNMKDVELVACPHYSDKATSVSSSKSKSEKELGTQVSDDGCSCKEESTDDTAVTANSPHIYACHSSLTGNYTSDQRYPLEKVCIFGYDFQTSSSSEEATEDETDDKTSSTK